MTIPLTQPTVPRYGMTPPSYVGPTTVLSGMESLIMDNLFPRWQKESERLDRIDGWLRWQHEDIRLPRRATGEHRALANVSYTPWLSLVVSSIAQCMFVDGVRFSVDSDEVASGADEPSPPWVTWLANGMDRQQIAVHRAALGYGYAFVSVLPGSDPLGSDRAVMRGVSPRKMFAAYEDPVEDDWPQYVLRVESRGQGNGWDLRLVDDVAVWRFTLESAQSKPEYVGQEIHDVGICPFVRYANMMDLDGRCDGEVEPVIPLAQRINKTSYDRMLVQHFNSWKVRTATGLQEPATASDAEQQKMRLRQDDILVSESENVKFGTLEETDVSPLVAAWRSDIEALAAVTQTPTHALTGQLVNLSAEALAAARAGLTQKVAERRVSFGSSHRQAICLAARVDGQTSYAEDTMARVSWQDMEIRSMSQAVDALGKAATMLQVPLYALWQRIPGVEKSDVDEWLRYNEEHDPMDRLASEIARQAEPAPQLEPSPSREPVES